MLQVNNLVGFGAGGSPSITESSYTGNHVSSGSFNIFSESVAIGAADENRLVVVGIGMSGTDASLGDPSSWGITIGGVSATIHAEHSIESGSEYYSACICSAVVPTGTTATVAGNNEQTASNLAIGAVRIVHGGTLTVTTDSATNGSASLAHVAGSVTVAIGQENSTSTNIAFANTTEEFEDDDGPGSNLGFAHRLHDVASDVTVTDSATFYALIANFSVS